MNGSQESVDKAVNYLNEDNKQAEQQLKITGYRKLTELEIGAMNDCKAIAIQVGILCDKVASMTNNDKRWNAIAKTQLQQGFMALIRSIAQPETF